RTRVVLDGAAASGTGEGQDADEGGDEDADGPGRRRLGSRLAAAVRAYGRGGGFAAFDGGRWGCCGGRLFGDGPFLGDFLREHAVDLDAEEEEEGRQVEPDQEDHNGPQGTVSLVVGAEIRDVEREANAR